MLICFAAPHGDLGETVVEQIKPFRIDYFYATENNIKGKRVNSIEMSNAIEHARKLVSNSKKITAFTGAGISVDSGIPDFRSDGGLWERFEPHEYATIESFKKNPTKFWTMGRALAETILQAKPNSAHIGLSKLESNKKLIGIITLNIDNLHQASGNKRIVELRGNYLRAHCVECNREYVGETVHQRVANGEIPPRCDVCKGVLKSEAILFGEPLPENAMREAVELCRNTDLMLVIGTSLSIYPAAYLPQLAKNEGAKIVLINLEGINRNDVADIVIRGRATEIIPKLVEY